MTPAQLKEAERQAEKDAEWLGLVLLTALAKKDSRTARQVSWNPSTLRFRYKGKLVPIRLIREYLIRIEQRIGNRLAKATLQLERGEITLEQWQMLFERNISSALLLSGGLALGGIGTAAANLLVQARMDSELRFAQQFIDRIRSNRAGSYSMIRARARRYMQAVHILYQQAEQIAQRTAGLHSEAKRVRRAAESCTGCLEYAGRWIPIELMPAIGTLQCQNWCRCYLIYR